MDFTILIPHYKNAKITAYCVSQLFKNKGKHEVFIIVIDNSPGDGSIAYLEPFRNKIKIIDYPTDILQSHGCAFDYAMKGVHTDYFITVESDAFPIDDKWLDYYEDLINQKVDCAGSLLKLSGGEYLHPAGALYKTSIWYQAYEYCQNIEYSYFPNMAKKNGFDSHLMVHQRVVNQLMERPSDFINLADNFKPYSIEKALEKLNYYKPVVAPFHNGMGNNDEDIATYGYRNLQSGVRDVLLNNDDPIIKRIGYEPGQWFCYWQLAVGKNVYQIPTQTIWMQNREYQQQERTIMENGFQHLWGMSALYNRTDENLQDVVAKKRQLVEELYESLPSNQKV